MTAAPERRRGPRLDPMSPERVALRAMLRYDPDDEAPTAPPAPEGDARDTQPSVLRVLVLGLLEAGAIGATLLAGSAFQVTSSAVAVPAIERVIATAAEVDALLAVRAADIQKQLEDGAQVITLADFPSGGGVPRADVVNPEGALDVTRLQGALVAQAAAARYAEDPALTEVGGSRDPLIATVAGALTARTHASARTVLAIAGGVAVLLAVALAATGARRGWLALGLALLAGGAVALGAGAVGGWLIEGVVAASGVLGATELGVARTLLEVPMRNGFIASAGGLVIALSAFIPTRRGARS